MNANNDSHRPIFLVEDNPLDIDLTLRAFKKQRLLNPIAVARDGEEAVEDEDEEKEIPEPLPLIVLMDLNLPKIDGLEVIRRFKDHPTVKRVPVVVLTSSSEDRDIATAYEYGANSYIIKPVDFDKFVSVASEIELYWLVTNQLPR